MRPIADCSSARLRPRASPYSTRARVTGAPPALRPGHGRPVLRRRAQAHICGWGRDRKSTRLNSSHGYISYAVFCLKKKQPSTHVLACPRLGVCPTSIRVSSCASWTRWQSRSFFFFNDTATTEIYTLSLHDALPISRAPRRIRHELGSQGRLLPCVLDTDDLYYDAARKRIYVAGGEIGRAHV